MDDHLMDCGIGDLSHLCLWVPLPGRLGSNDDEANTRLGRPDWQKAGKYYAALAGENQNSDGENGPSTSTTRKTRIRRQRRLRADSESDLNFESGSDQSETDSEDDSDIQIIDHNGLADSLPTRTMPENSKRKKGAGSKRKGDNLTTPKKRRKKRGVDGDGGEEPSSGSSSKVAPVNATPDVSVENMGHDSDKKSRKTNPIYYFYEQVSAPPDMTANAGDVFYKCYLGNHKVFKITKAMRSSVLGLTGHLKSKFPAHHRLFEVLKQRKTPPTAKEIQLANGTATIDPLTAEKYLQELQNIDNNIKAMFEKQAAAAREPWDQAHFEDLLAKWIAACDQPFTTVTDVEFWDLLQYTHHPAGKTLHIPGEQAIWCKVPPAVYNKI
ncbi:hypothetical protein PM082_014407 [Marasmius tenuissimus]|nr:hypothetical protein PM082_014407 [Marasmius tenuissimus]